MVTYNKVSDIGDTHTLQEFISLSGSLPTRFDHRSFCMIEKRDGVDYPIHNVIDDYMPELKEQAMTITLTSQERDKYMYNPKLLSYRIYGTTLWYHIILRLSNLCNIHEFTIPTNKLLLIPTNALKTILGQIYSSNSTAIKQYNTKHANDSVPNIIRKKR